MCMCVYVCGCVLRGFLKYNVANVATSNRVVCPIIGRDEGEH